MLSCPSNGKPMKWNWVFWVWILLSPELFGQYETTKQITSARLKEVQALWGSGIVSDSLVVAIVVEGNTDSLGMETCFMANNREQFCARLSVDSVLDARKVADAQNFYWHLMQGHALFNRFRRFYNQSDHALQWLHRATDAYRAAWQHEVCDAQSLYGLAYGATIERNYAEASVWYSLSVQHDSLSGVVWFDYAVNNLFAQNSLGAETAAFKAYGLLPDSVQKSDAARILGIASYENGKFDQALHYFAEANRLSPGFLMNQLFLLRSFLQQCAYTESITLSDIIFSSNAHSADVADRIFELYRIARKNAWYARHVEGMLHRFAHDDEARGNLLFHYGKQLYLNGQKRKALRVLNQSGRSFGKVLPPNHQVFEAIEQMTRPALR